MDLLAITCTLPLEGESYRATVACKRGPSQYKCMANFQSYPEEGRTPHRRKILENQGYLALATHPSKATLVSKREHYSRLQNETIERVPGTWRLSFPCIALLPRDCFVSFSLRPVQLIISGSGGISPRGNFHAWEGTVVPDNRSGS